MEIKNKKELNYMKEILEIEHKLKMERLQYERETNRLFHERALERERIKNADIRRNIERRY